MHNMLHNYRYHIKQNYVNNKVLPLVIGKLHL